MADTERRVGRLGWSLGLGLPEPHAMRRRLLTGDVGRQTASWHSQKLIKRR